MNLTKQALVLLIEDNPADAELVSEALAEAHVECELQVLVNGKSALDFILSVDQETSACPDLILLDLNLPLVSGEEVLRRIRTSLKCSSVRVLIFSSSNAPGDRRMAMELGATDYFRKPSSLTQYMELGSKVRELLNR